MGVVTVVTAVLGVEASPANAEETSPTTFQPKPEEAPTTEAAATIDVRVDGERKGRPPKVGASDYDIVLGQLSDVPRGNAERILSLAPGVFLANHGGEGHPSSIFLRGFDAGEGQDLELTVDGVPINEPSNPHGHGFADLNFIIPALVSRVRVIEGPYDPAQGDFAVAGSAQYTLALAQRGMQARAGYGSFGRGELLALWGPAGWDDDTYAGVELVRGDGFGRNRSHRAVRAMGQIARTLDDDVRVGVSATSYATEFGSAGVLRLDAVRERAVPSCGISYDEQFFCSVDETQGGAVQRHGVSAWIRQNGAQRSLEGQVFGTVKTLRIRENFTGYLTDVAPNGGAQRGDGIEQVEDVSTVGARARAVRRLRGFGDRVQEAEIGLYTRHDRINVASYRLRTADGVPYATTFNSDLAITNAALFAGGKLHPWSWLVLRGGVRFDGFVFGIQDLNEADVDRVGTRVPSSRREAFGIAVQPRLTVAVPFAPWLTWMTSAGLGSRSSDAQALSDGESAPFARVVATETGIVSRVAQARRSAEGRLVAFATRVEDDLVFDEVAGNNTPIGPSNRYGLAASGRITDAPSGLDVSSSFTFAEAFLSSEDETLLDVAAGPRLPYAPRWVARLDASERRPFRVAGELFLGTLALGLSLVDERPLPLERFGAAYGAMDAAARLRWRYVEVGVEVENLMDRRNREVELSYASNFGSPSYPASELPARHFVAGAPRQFLATLALYWDDEKEEEGLAP